MRRAHDRRDQADDETRNEAEDNAPTARGEHDRKKEHREGEVSAKRDGHTEEQPGEPEKERAGPAAETGVDQAQAEGEKGNGPDPGERHHRVARGDDHRDRPGNQPGEHSTPPPGQGNERGEKDEVVEDGNEPFGQDALPTDEERRGDRVQVRRAVDRQERVIGDCTLEHQRGEGKQAPLILGPGWRGEHRRQRRGKGDRQQADHSRGDERPLTAFASTVGTDSPMRVTWFNSAGARVVAAKFAKRRRDEITCRHGRVSGRLRPAADSACSRAFERCPLG